MWPFKKKKYVILGVKRISGGEMIRTVVRPCQSGLGFIPYAGGEYILDPGGKVRGVNNLQWFPRSGWTVAELRDANFHEEAGRQALPGGWNNEL